jgi:hypothetical protein
MGPIHSQAYNGWVISFKKNVHMYTHSLKAEKNGETYDIPCEDTPFDFVAIWPYQLNLEDPLLQDLIHGLRDWIEQTDMTYRLYTTGDDYLTEVKALTESRI